MPNTADINVHIDTEKFDKTLGELHAKIKQAADRLEAAMGPTSPREFAGVCVHVPMSFTVAQLDKIENIYHFGMQGIAKAISQYIDETLVGGKPEPTEATI